MSALIVVGVVVVVGAVVFGLWATLHPRAVARALRRPASGTAPGGAQLPERVRGELDDIRSKDADLQVQIDGAVQIPGDLIDGDPDVPDADVLQALRSAGNGSAGDLGG